MTHDRDLSDYIADNYGVCARGAGCYWGRDSHGEFDGCLRNGWRGRACSHWQPVAVRTWDELMAMLAARKAIS